VLRQALLAVLLRLVQKWFLGQFPVCLMLLLLLPGEPQQQQQE
jgi:hypothetical protein